MEPIEVGVDEDEDVMRSMVVLPPDDSAPAATNAKTPIKASPLGRKFAALRDAIREAKTVRMHGHPAATIEHWRTQCGKHGLFDGDPRKDNKNRALFSKYRRELMVGNIVQCDETMVWTRLMKEADVGGASLGTEPLDTLDKEIPF
jgi:hypothetical protein